MLNLIILIRLHFSSKIKLTQVPVHVGISDIYWQDIKYQSWIRLTARKGPAKWERTQEKGDKYNASKEQ